MTHLHIYTSLKHLGFSPAKAAEIILDAKRGSQYARQFIKAAFKNRH